MHNIDEIIEFLSGEIGLILLNPADYLHVRELVAEVLQQLLEASDDPKAVHVELDCLVRCFDNPEDGEVFRVETLLPRLGDKQDFLLGLAALVTEANYAMGEGSHAALEAACKVLDKSPWQLLAENVTELAGLAITIKEKDAMIATMASKLEAQG